MGYIEVKWENTISLIICRLLAHLKLFSLGCTKHMENSQHTATLVVLSTTAQGNNFQVTWQP